LTEYRRRTIDAPQGTAMTNPGESICPICKSQVPLLDRTGDFTGYDYQIHGRFKVSGVIFAIPSKLNASRERWEAALKHAKARAKPGEWAPLITSDDL
jgi:hypothetical protein